MYIDDFIWLPDIFEKLAVMKLNLKSGLNVDGV